jgi:hypothetical protein
MVVAGIEPATSSLWTEALNTRLVLLGASDQTVAEHTARSPCRALWNQWFFFWAKIRPKSPQFEDFSFLKSPYSNNMIQQKVTKT